MTIPRSRIVLAFAILAFVLFALGFLPNLFKRTPVDFDRTAYQSVVLGMAEDDVVQALGLAPGEYVEGPFGRHLGPDVNESAGDHRRAVRASQWIGQTGILTVHFDGNHTVAAKDLWDIKRRPRLQWWVWHHEIVMP